MNVNERINLLREQILELSLSAFANEIGMSKASVSRIENGKQEVSNRTIIVICSRFDICENWLKFGIGETTRKEETPPEPRNNKMKYIYDSIESMNDGQISLLIHYIEALKKTP